jgi:hypothetical protein
MHGIGHTVSWRPGSFSFSMSSCSVYDVTSIDAGAAAVVQAMRSGGAYAWMGGEDESTEQSERVHGYAVATANFIRELVRRGLICIVFDAEEAIAAVNTHLERVDGFDYVLGQVGFDSVVFFHNVLCRWGQYTNNPVPYYDSVRIPLDGSREIRICVASSKVFAGAYRRYEVRARLHEFGLEKPHC